MDEELKGVLTRWLLKADNDLRTAEFALSAAEPTTDTICFHCQQAAEKYLKMFLIRHGNEPVFTHNISVLVETCAVLDPDFHSLADCDFLTAYAVTLRYPDDFYIPAVEEAAVALAAAQRVRSFVLGKVPGL
jgi:HEPN domain-containing protein